MGYCFYFVVHISFRESCFISLFISVQSYRFLVEIANFLRFLLTLCYQISWWLAQNDNFSFFYGIQISSFSLLEKFNEKGCFR